MAEQDDAPAAAETQPRVRRALLSVSDKRGLVEFASGLVELGVEIVSTGGTAQALADGGIETRSIADYTGFPEILDGRVKTLNPRIHAGLLAIRDDPEHLRTLAEQEIEPIDLVCVNLYPFEATVARRDVSDAEVIEKIDVGGPTMIRAAAKNHAFVAIVVEPESYDAVLDELRAGGETLSDQTRQALAADAFAHTARYDAAIASWFARRGSVDFPPLIAVAWEKELDLPYGENPHQRAAFYSQARARTHLLSQVSQLHGKELSFNNLLDLDAARRLIDEFELPASVIVKHNNPCGCAMERDVNTAFEHALATDRMSAFGGIFCFNRPVDRALAEQLSEIFVELVFAPGYDDAALDILQAKPNVRILVDHERRDESVTEWDMKRVRGGLLLQDRDRHVETRDEMEVVTERKPSDSEWGDLLFAWKVSRHVRSNAIVLAKDLATVGVGAGQMSRVDSVRVAIEKSRDWDAAMTPPLAGAALASDAFFPFADGPQTAFDAGVTAVIQPGGSQRDPEVVEAADAAGAAMVFTRRRHFRH
ncbi:MAG: bifunctional phosphoribosylaminoimidazolecarboxamide formyltransferase/IMP cyclohydrolase [Thermoleophilaceae bacterium]|nr:bifunctional phosphoribosylaminoimidazolecarboxamide formyltransferase/IMP cyclohydrolase [Thermoleophilaceae bacterium]